MRGLLAIVLGVSLSACAYSAVKRPAVNRYASRIERARVVDSDAAAALAAAKSALEGMGYEIQTVNADLRLVRTKARPALIPSVCDCGTWNRRTVQGTCESVMVVTAQGQDDGRSTLTVAQECATTFAGRNLYGHVTRQETYSCASTGAAEGQFWETLTKVLAARATK